MRWIKEFFMRDQWDRDLRDEIRAHLEIEKAQRIGAGETPEDAERKARLAFGSVTNTYAEVRETWGWASIERLWQDIRFGMRTLRKTPVWTFVVAATLALGIGITTAIFSLVYTVLLQPLPYADPDRIVSLAPTATKNGGDTFRVSAALWRRWQEQLKLVDQIALTRPVANFNLTGVGAPARLQGARTTFNVPLTLGGAPALGRYFTREEQFAGARVAVLSHAFWVRKFAADAAILGRKVQMNGEPFEVIGVMPATYSYPDASFEIWTPLYIPAAEFQHGINHQYLSIGRLRPGATVDQARVEILGVAGQLANEYPSSYRAGNEWIGATVERLSDSQSLKARGPLLGLMIAATCLLLIGCLNLAILLIARASARTREMAVRVALGGGVGRLLRQLLAEALPLSAAGAGGGVFLAWILMRTMTPWLPPDLPRVETLGLHLPVLMFSLGSSLAIVLLASLLPARMVARADVNEALKKGSRSVSGGRGAREPLVIAQVALAVTLIFGCVLLGRSLGALLRVSPGFSPQNVLTMHLAVTRAKYPTDAQVADYYDRMVANVKAIPGVLEAGIVNRLPLAGLTQTGGIEFEGKQGAFTADWRVATPGYFGAMKIPLKQGRLLSERDRPAGVKVGMIDEDLARKVFGNDTPIGKRFRRFISANTTQDPWVEIVGVVGHVRNVTLEKDPRPQVYWPESQAAQDRGALVVRTAGQPEAYAPAVMERIREVNPEQPVYEVRSMEAWVAKSTQSRSLTTSLSSLFGIASLILACLGIYGVVSYTTAQRFREFGVRLALGANGAMVRNSVLGQAGRLAFLGVALGLILCWPAGRILRSMLFGVSSFDAMAWSLAPGLLIAAALVAGLGPALRAAKTDPAEVLRSE